jgi:hypothetical protein
MRQNNGARAVTAEQPATPTVAPRFTRAAHAERSRLKSKREQLLCKREAAQAEVERIDRAVGSVDELLELLAPLLAGNGGEAGAPVDDSSPGAERGAGGSERGEARERDRAQPSDPQPAKE